MQVLVSMVFVYARLVLVCVLPPRYFEQTILAGRIDTRRTRLSSDRCDATFELGCFDPRGRARLDLFTADQQEEYIYMPVTWFCKWCVSADMEPLMIDPYPGFDFHTFICLANPSSNITDMNSLV
jgi:hypothetical protein